MRPRILLVNPPVYDFAAYDFWLRPYGLLSVAGQLRQQAEFVLFDYMDRRHPFMAARENLRSDRWGRGRFYCRRIERRESFAGIPRYLRRFGLPRDLFLRFLIDAAPFDVALVQTVMTYWYPGVREVIEDVRLACPTAKIVLGGNYATLCPAHAGTQGADLVIADTDLAPLWAFLGLGPDPDQPALWELYERPASGAVKLSDGCPFHCSYCSVPQVYGRFRARPLGRALAELDLLIRCGSQNVAFYDDALLFDAEKVLVPFLERVIQRGTRVNFHTPNALNARFLTQDLAQLMVAAGFKTFYLGFESASRRWQDDTGGKVYSEELARAVDHLRAAGAEPNDITAYQILGHPNSDSQDLEASMHFVQRLGIRGMLADFSPIPGTPDGEASRRWVDLDEPLEHNNTAFTIRRLGFGESNRLKDLQRRLNREVRPGDSRGENR
jgi:hypothetical protein